MKRLFKILACSFIISGLTLSNLTSETIHIVKPNETLYSISRLYNLSVDEIKKANGLSDNTVRVDQKLSIPDSDKSVGKKEESENKNSSNPEFHTVQSNETLYSISRLYKMSVDELKELNGLSSNNVLIGQKLKIAKSESTKKDVSTSETKKTKTQELYYTVKSGDTLLEIACNYGLSLTGIAKLNNISENATLKIGQRLKVVDVPDLDDPHVYASKKGDASLVWPVNTTEVTYVNGKVNGVSLVTKKNESVKSIMSGTVENVEPFRGYGNVVFIRSKTDHVYAYTGMSDVSVSKGDYIEYGTKIGTVGIDVFSQQPHIYLMVWQGNKLVDPAKAPRG